MTTKRFGTRNETHLEETKRIARVFEVARLLSGQPGQWKRAALANRFEVSERAIDRDLTLLRGIGYAINRAAGGGYAFDRAPAMPPLLLSLQEAVALTLAAGLARDSGDVDTVSLASALAQLEAGLPASARPIIRQELLERGERAESYQRRQAVLEIIRYAHMECRRLRVVYETAMRGGALTERVIEPYALFSYDRSWMVTAFDHHRQQVRDFKVDRVHTAEMLEETYTIPTDFSLRAYRGAGWGILRGETTEPVDIVLLFDAEAGRWAREEQRDQHTIFEELSGSGIRACLTAGITPEFVRWVFSWGPGCRVEQPITLRERVRAMAEQTIVVQR